jgi:hypothetical protein
MHDLSFCKCKAFYQCLCRYGSLPASVVDRHLFDGDPDTGPTFHFDADLDPDPTFHFDADPDLVSYRTPSFIPVGKTGIFLFLFTGKECQFIFTYLSLRCVILSILGTGVEDRMFIPRSMGHDSIHRITYTYL